MLPQTRTFARGFGMKQSFSFVILAVALAGCRDYDLGSRVKDQSGLVPPEQFARYGREQAQAVAIAREYSHAIEESQEDPGLQGERATSYARTLPDVRDAAADPLGFRQTIRFRSGWLTMVTPMDDGKRGSETPGVPAEATPATGR